MVHKQSHPDSRQLQDRWGTLVDNGVDPASVEPSSGSRSATTRTDSKSMLRCLVWGVIALCSAGPLAYVVHLINQTSPDNPERAVLFVGGLFAILLVLPPAVYLCCSRRS